MWDLWLLPVKPLTPLAAGRGESSVRGLAEAHPEIGGFDQGFRWESNSRRCAVTGGGKRKTIEFDVRSTRRPFEADSLERLTPRQEGPEWDPAPLSPRLIASLAVRLVSLTDNVKKRWQIDLPELAKNLLVGDLSHARGLKGQRGQFGLLFISISAKRQNIRYKFMNKSTHSQHN